MQRLSILSWEGVPPVRSSPTNVVFDNQTLIINQGRGVDNSVSMRLRQVPTSTKAVVKKPAVDNFDGRLTD